MIIIDGPRKITLSNESFLFAEQWMTAVVRPFLTLFRSHLLPGIRKSAANATRRILTARPLTSRSISVVYVRLIFIDCAIATSTVHDKITLDALVKFAIGASSAGPCEGGVSMTA